MAYKGLGPVLGLGLGLFAAWAEAHGADPTPALTVRLVRPDVQCERVLALFRGARAPHPAAALAAWKRATAPRGTLGKPLEAAIAAFNPEMARELRALDQSELVLAFDADDGAARWHATLPRDDGTFAALATALVLTGGGSDPPLGALAVDRLGPAGAPLSARADVGLVVAGSRPALVDAIDPGRPRARAGWPGFAPPESCAVARLDPEGLGRSGPVARRQLAEVLRALGCRSLDACAHIEGETLTLALLMSPVDAPPRRPTAATIDPAWLDELPAVGLLAAFAWALDPGAAAWDRAFALADRVERADPARDGVAPLRTRINLLAATVRVRPELDLWPCLRGLSGALLVDPEGRIDGALLALHTDGPASAGRLAGQVLPRLAPLLGLRPVPDGAPDGPRLLGRFRDRPLYLDQQGATVRLGWGESSHGPLRDARVQPARSVGPLLRALAPWGEAPPQRLGAFWPGRLASAAKFGAPLARTLAEAPPVVWSGHSNASGASDLVRWTGLRGLVHRSLDQIPLDPPPDR
jgi:hypothetical protein